MFLPHILLVLLSVAIIAYYTRHDTACSKPVIAANLLLIGINLGVMLGKLGSL